MIKTYSKINSCFWEKNFLFIVGSLRNKQTGCEEKKIQNFVLLRQNVNINTFDFKKYSEESCTFICKRTVESYDLAGRHRVKTSRM
jgi:hypothetical protein